MKSIVELAVEIEVDPIRADRAHEWLHARLASFLSNGIPWTAMGMAGIDAITLVDFRKVKEAA